MQGLIPSIHLIHVENWILISADKLNLNMNRALYLKISAEQLSKRSRSDESNQKTRSNNCVNGVRANPCCSRHLLTACPPKVSRTLMLHSHQT